MIYPQNTSQFFKRLSTLLFLAAGTQLPLNAASNPSKSADAANIPNLQVYCGTGDNLWNHKVEPVDSPAAIEAMLEWMAKTYGVSRLYWRGAQEELWKKYFREGEYDPLIAGYMKWTSHLYKDLGLTAAAVKAAKKNGMEVFMYTGLLEFGVQPDVGVIHPHLFEDTLRVENPQWCPLDRWGQRRSPGPICFGYPEARKIVIDRLMKQILDGGFDGIIFYTYVENIGIRYEDEFGFNQPIVDEFNKKYPDVDLRKATLTPEQKKYWYKCRGKFVTDFLSELHAQLAAHGKKLSMILDPTEPDYAQRWWGKKLHGAGRIFMDWENWIKQGLVDEIWVQIADVKSQTDFLDVLLEKTRGTPVKVTVRAVDPLAEVWKPYIEQGVTPVAVITWEKNGIERISLEPTSLATLKSRDWKLRAQTLSDIAHKQLKATVRDIAPLAKDPEVLVRHRAVKALAIVGGNDAVPILENALEDRESSVRIAAADALAKVNGPKSAEKLLKAVGQNDFQFNYVAGTTLVGLAPKSPPVLLQGLDSPNPNVQAVSARVLRGTTAEPGQRAQIYQALRKVLLDPKASSAARVNAMNNLTGGYLDFSKDLPNAQVPLVADLLSLLNSGAPPDVEVQVANSFKTMARYMTPAQKTEALDALEKLFRTYGDGCERPDAAYGWRIVGNAILFLQGKDRLEAMRTQKDDKWLAWNAYEVVYLFQDLVIKDKAYSFNEVDEKQAIADHEKYAPEFPGWRKW